MFLCSIRINENPILKQRISSSSDIIILHYVRKRLATIEWIT